MEPKAWQATVEMLTACSCNWGCPCSFQAPPTYGRCEAALAYRVLAGAYGDVSLDGLRWGLVAGWPGPLHELGGRGIVYLDSRAEPAQLEALEAIATGRAGGPIGVFMSTITAGLEARVARVDIRPGGAESRFEIEGAADVRFEPIRNPVTGAAHEASLDLPHGMLTKREHYYSAATFSVDAGELRFSYPGRNAIASVGSWRGP